MTEEIKTIYVLKKELEELYKENKKLKQENKVLNKIKQNYINYLQQEFETRKIEMLNNISFPNYKVY